MKAILTIASALFAFTASAGEYSGYKYVRYESVTFQSASTWVPGNLVCRDGNVLKHTKKATVEVEYCESTSKDTDKNCYYVSKPLAQPVVVMKNICVAYSGKEDSICTKYAKQKFDQSSVKVYGYNNSESSAETYLGKYVIPACKTGGGEAF